MSEYSFRSSFRGHEIADEAYECENERCDPVIQKLHGFLPNQHRSLMLDLQDFDRRNCRTLFKNNGPTSPIDTGQIRDFLAQGVLTFRGCDSSSTGYHFWAFWAGTVLWPFPNCFVWPTVESDILAAGDEGESKRMKGGWLSTAGGCWN